MSTGEKPSSYYKSAAYKALDGVMGTSAPFSLGRGSVKFRGQRIDARLIDSIYVSKWSIFPAILSVGLLGFAWLFLDTSIFFLNALIISLLATNAFLVTIAYFKENGFRLLVVRLNGGKRLFAYVGALTAEPMERIWRDIVTIMPDLVGRDRP
jgi:hypothetical protein